MSLDEKNINAPIKQVFYYIQAEISLIWTFSRYRIEEDTNDLNTLNIFVRIGCCVAPVRV